MGNRSAVPVNDIQPLGRCCVVGSSGPAFLVSSPGSFQRCLAIITSTSDRSCGPPGSSGGQDACGAVGLWS